MTNTTDSLKVHILEAKDGAVVCSDVGGVWRLLTPYEFADVRAVCGGQGNKEWRAISGATAIAIRISD